MAAVASVVPLPYFEASTVAPILVRSGIPPGTPTFPCQVARRSTGTISAAPRFAWASIHRTIKAKLPHGTVERLSNSMREERSRSKASFTIRTIISGIVTIAGNINEGIHLHSLPRHSCAVLIDRVANGTFLPVRGHDYEAFEAIGNR